MRMNDSLTDLVSLNKEGIAVTTSLILAKGLKRRHSDVLRSIDCLTRDICGREGDYILSHYSSNGKKYRIYEITKDGLTLFHVRNPKTFGIFMERVLGGKNVQIDQPSPGNPDSLNLLMVNQLKWSTKIGGRWSDDPFCPLLPEVHAFLLYFKKIPRFNFVALRRSFLVCNPDFLFSHVYDNTRKMPVIR